MMRPKSLPAELVEAGELIADFHRMIDRHEAEYAALRVRQRAEANSLNARIDRTLASAAVT